MKRLFLLFALIGVLCVQSLSAQVIKGDMNDDGVFDIDDVNASVNTVVGKRAIQYVQGGGDPYMIDNNRVAGTWYLSKNECFTLNADGTTDYVSELGDVATYEFLPYQGVIIFYNNADNPISWIEVKKLMPGRMICNLYDKGDKLYVLTSDVPTQFVTSILLNSTNLTMEAGESKQMTATVLPEDADNKSVAWESSDESVVRTSGDQIVAMANGTAVITCRATDGSGVKAECTVTVREDLSGKDSMGREYVDLDLPGGVLWASWNVGASNPEESGKYFAWGETVGYAKGETHSFDWANYKWMAPGHGSWMYVTKYTTADGVKNGHWYSGDTYVGTTVDGVNYKNLTELLPEDDAATANWGTGWRMPSIREIQDLFNSDYTTSEWVTVNGVYGRKVTSKSNGNSIFLPAAGYFEGTTLNSEGYFGDYWSRDLFLRLSYDAYSLGFGQSRVYVDDFPGRNYGRSIRAVRVPSE